MMNGTISYILYSLIASFTFNGGVYVLQIICSNYSNYYHVHMCIFINFYEDILFKV